MVYVKQLELIQVASIKIMQHLVSIGTANFD